MSNQSLPGPNPNASAEANQLFTNRQAMHAANGGTLVGMVVTEFLAYPRDAIWANAVGPDSPNTGVSVRRIYGRGGHIKAQVVVGTLPCDGPESLGSSDFPLVSVV
jgi:hypothetical protein